MSSTSAAVATGAAAHILVIPYPAQGHMLALLDLTHQLALHGLQITILVTPKNLPILDSLLSTHPISIQTLILPFPTNPKLPFGVENVKDIGNDGNAPIIAALSKLDPEIIQWFQSHPSPPQAILSDFFLGWTQLLAEHLNIPRIGFFSVAAFLISIMTHLWLNIDTLRNSLEVVEFPDLPRSPYFAKEHLPSIFRKYREGDCDWEIVRKGMLVNSKSWACVFNSFYGLEGEYLDHLKKLVHGRVYTVGPVSLMGGSERIRKKVGPDSSTRCGVLNWLDKCPDGSVLYVCFGSQKLLTRPQMEALASGLERSKTRFVWVVNAAAASQDSVPTGFEERVADRGFVLRGWAPQADILSHRAVGGFLSHCGWNSLLESVEVGVMILAWPMEADQFVNARLLVEDIGAAVRLCEGEYTVPDSDELARIIDESVSGDNDIPQKERMKLMKRKAFEAVKAGGSSSRDLDELVKHLIQLPRGT